MIGLAGIQHRHACTTVHEHKIVITFYQKLQPASSVALGIGKRIMNGKGNLRFNVSDVFWSNLGNGVTNLNNYQLTIRQWNETRRATLSFSWNFGKSTVQAARNRTSSAEEERSRAQ